MVGLFMRGGDVHQFFGFWLKVLKRGPEFGQSSVQRQFTAGSNRTFAGHTLHIANSTVLPGGREPLRLTFDA